ncbi:GDP-mannose 4,6 dehydratase [Klosneuvirus KNV1]|uniref:GDP-mannose 4,6-dehydratase n=1 Tax=Klosneuvirus KNV1 TaxID=1977640 RepID=A0A1V0SJ73_9VIRU|nr:GDP-mannose 4,6 dehydratase [Klosneuvirus KNV1]
MKIAFITGITGQAGSFLAELLLSKDYIVWGLIRKTSTNNTSRIQHLLNNNNLIIKYGDMCDGTNLTLILQEIKAKYNNLERLEVYNLAAQSHVQVSFEVPLNTSDVDGLGVLRILDAIRLSGLQHLTRFYQASTSELFGKVHETPQSEKTPFYPRSPYGVSKLYGFWITKNYRESYNMFACNGILFNNESNRRGEEFVTRKITKSLGMILRGETDRLVLGNLDAIRDWGHTKDYVYGMWLMLQKDKPDDYVLATGKPHSVREFVEKAFSLKNIYLKWKGKEINEIGYDMNTGKEYVFVSEKYFRPAEVDLLLGCNDKAKKELSWEPSIDFDELIREMVEHDCK